MKSLGSIPELFRTLPTRGIVAEVGVWLGDNAAVLLRCMQPTRLFLVDHWKNVQDPTNKALLGDDSKRIAAAYSKVVNRFFADRRVVIMRMGSLQAAKSLRGGLLDVCYLDASHLYRNVLEDLRAWSYCVRPGGFLCGHDWDYYPDVNRAVTEFLKERPDCQHEYVAGRKGHAKAYALRIRGTRFRG